MILVLKIASFFKVFQHWIQSAYTDNGMLSFNNIKFSFKNKVVIMEAYNSLVKPHLIYAVQIRYSHHANISKIGVQRTATKMFSSLRKTPYKERILCLIVFSLVQLLFFSETEEMFHNASLFYNVSSAFFLYQQHVTRKI